MHCIVGIYGICDNSPAPEKSHRDIAERLLQGGIKILQLRMKGETDLAKVRLAAESILGLKRDFDFTFILNDFVELAAELGIDGVHLGKDDESLEVARRRLGTDRLIGYSSHSLPEALEAQAKGADYVAFGAIFPTALKGPGHPVQGTAKLRDLVRQIKIPVVAIGGINRTNIREVKATGVAAVAMIGALAGAPDPVAEARWFEQYWRAP